LPNYITTHSRECRDWDVVYDDRGHFLEPHTGRMIGLGTLNVRDYLKKVRPLRLDAASFSSASIETYGPDGCYGAMLYVEKEGFMPLFERVRLAQRYDIAIMSSKGMSVTAARELVNRICSSEGVPLFVLHDFDGPGIIIKDTLENDTRRFSYTYKPNVIDLGLSYDDIDDLEPEPYICKISSDRLEQAGLDTDAIDFLMEQRVELNAMTSRQLVDFVERKLNEHGITKVIPDADTLARTYRMFAASDQLAEKFDELKDRLEDEADDVEVPADLKAKIEKLLKEKLDITWHRAVRLSVDPDAPEDEDNEDDDDDGGGDEELSDIDE
jgi:DNA topoisomerase 6 subunit A-like protein